MTPEDLPTWLLELVKDHEPLEEHGYVSCTCGWNVYGSDTVGYAAHLLALAVPELRWDFLAKASGGWQSLEPGGAFGQGRVRRYSVAEIKQELLERYNRGEL